MEYFSIEVLITVVRESIEAALIIGILLAYLSKTGNKTNKKDIWIGTVGAIILTIISGIFLWTIYDLIPATFLPYFEGSVMLVAAVILSTMIVWMYKHGRTLKSELEDRSEKALSTGNRLGLIAVPFISVLREGVETVLFLAALKADGASDLAIVSSTALGVVLAAAIAILMFKSMINFNLRTFFNVTSVLLIGLAFFLLRTGIHEFQEVGALFGESLMGILLQVMVLAGYAIFLWQMYKKVNSDIQKMNTTTAIAA